MMLMMCYFQRYVSASFYIKNKEHIWDRNKWVIFPVINNDLDDMAIALYKSLHG